MQNKKIIIGVLVSSLPIGGAEQLLYHLSQYIDKNKFTMIFFFLKNFGTIGLELQKSAVPCYSIPFSKFSMLPTLIKINKALTKNNVDIILTINHRNALFLSIVSSLIFHKKLIINWENEMHKTYKFNGIFLNFKKFFRYKIHKTVAAANIHAEYIHKTEGANKKSIQTIFNGVEVPSNITITAKNESKNKLKLSSSTVCIGIIASLRHDKGHDLLLKSLKCLMDRGTDFHCLIIGDGPQQKELTRLATQNGIVNKISFLGYRRDIKTILPAIDVLVLPSRPQQETLSVAALEAMAYSLPVIATNVGAMKEIVITNETGILINPESIEELTEALHLVISDANLRKTLGENARNLVNDNYTVDKMVHDFEVLFTNTTTSNESGKILIKKSNSKYLPRQAEVAFFSSVLIFKLLFSSLKPEYLFIKFSLAFALTVFTTKIFDLFIHHFWDKFFQNSQLQTMNSGLYFDTWYLLAIINLLFFATAPFVSWKVVSYLI